MWGPGLVYKKRALRNLDAIAIHRNIGNCVPIIVLGSDFRGDLASPTSVPSKLRALTLTRLSDGGYRTGVALGLEAAARLGRSVGAAR